VQVTVFEFVVWQQPKPVEALVESEAVVYVDGAVIPLALHM